METCSVAKNIVVNVDMMHVSIASLRYAALPVSTHGHCLPKPVRHYLLSLLLARPPYSAGTVNHVVISRTNLSFISITGAFTCGCRNARVRAIISVAQAM